MVDSSSAPGDMSILVEHGTLNLVGGNLMHVMQDSGQASPQPLSPQPGNHAPLDLLSIHFTGRTKELELLQKIFSKPQGKRPSRCAVYGMPGLGKTQLMLRYAKVSFDQRQYSHIFWISATSVDKLNQGIAGILDLVGFRDHYHHDQRAKLTTARLWLEGTSTNWLLILDNVDRTTFDFLREHLPRENNQGHVLFTTRTADVAEALANAAGEKNPTLRLQALDLRDTANLFFEDAGIISENVAPSDIAQAEALVKCVGCLPLAVVQAASFKKQTHTPLDEMLRLYKGKERIEAIRWENDLSPYEERSVAATFTRLLAQLNLKSRDASNLLKVLSFYDPESIPLEIFEWLRRRDESPHTLLQPASTISQEISSLIALILSPIQVKTAIQKLQQLSLVERRTSIGEPLLMHDLIQFMTQEGAKKEETYRNWLELSVLLVCGAFGDIKDPALPDRWDDCEKFLPHLRSLNQRWNDVRDTSLELAQANVKVAGYLLSRGRYDEAEKMLRQALKSMENLLGDDHLDTLSCVSVLANACRLQSRFNESETLHRRAWVGREKQLGADHLDTLWSMSALAAVYRLQGQLGDAERLQDQVVVGRERRLGASHLDTLWSMSRLASVYRLQGRFDQAEKLHQQALDGRERQLGPDHPDTVWSMGALANVYRSQRRLDEAEELLKRVLDTRQKQLGADHPNTLWSMSTLANVYRWQGRFNEAEALHQQAFDGREKQLGVDNPDTLWSMGALADVYLLQGRPHEAEERHKRALEDMRTQLGVDHPNTHCLMGSLAAAYELQGKLKEAEELYERALMGRQKQLGANHFKTLASMASLANVYKSQGRFCEAEKLYKDALAGREEHLGADHPDTLSSVNSLANMYRLQGRFIEAEELDKA